MSSLLNPITLPFHFPRVSRLETTGGGRETGREKPSQGEDKENPHSVTSQCIAWRQPSLFVQAPGWTNVWSFPGLFASPTRPLVNRKLHVYSDVNVQNPFLQMFACKCKRSPACKTLFDSLWGLSFNQQCVGRPVSYVNSDSIDSRNLTMHA